MKAKGKQKEAAKPDPDADYIDDDEDFGYIEEEPRNRTSPTTAWTPNPSDKEQA